MENTIEKKLIVDEFNEEDKKIISLLHEYLEKNYKIKKKNSFFLLKNKNNKIVIDINSINKIIKNNSYLQYNPFISRFLLKSLKNKWEIEKNQNNYILSRRHNGKKEYFSKKYLTEFMKNNF